MCRFALYLGPEITVSSLVTESSHSIIHQSYKSEEREEPLNGDGFGIGWYVPSLSEEPAVFRSVSPAWNNQNLRRLARVTRSHCVLAHIRAATPGLPVTELNCHPFAAHRYAFMHNGVIGGFSRIRRRILARLTDPAFDCILGSTDSEHAFALFLDHVRRGNDPSSDGLHAAMVETIGELEAIRRDAGVDEPSLLNFAVTDGDVAIATRFTSDPAHHATLYAHTGKRYVCKGGVCRMLDPDESGSAVLVASEPLSDDDGWEPVGMNQAVVIDENRNVTTRPALAR